MKKPNHAKIASLFLAMGVLGGMMLPASAESVTLQWDRSPSSNVTQYRVYRATSATGAFSVVATTAATQAIISNTGSAAGHRFQIKAINAQGVESDPSNTAELSPDPTYSRVGSRLSIQWNAPGYALQTASNPAGPWTLQSTVSPVFIDFTGARKFFRLWKQ